MNVDAIRDGIVIDHIAAGSGMKLYRLLGLEQLDVPVAMMTRVPSRKLGRKDIIKIDADVPVNMDVIGYVDPGATVNLIRDGRLAEKRRIGLPERLVNVLRCRNPRCVSTCEQELEQVFVLSSAEKREYRSGVLQLRDHRIAAKPYRALFFCKNFFNFYVVWSCAFPQYVV